MANKLSVWSERPLTSDPDLQVGDLVLTGEGGFEIYLGGARYSELKAVSKNPTFLGVVDELPEKRSLDAPLVERDTCLFQADLYQYDGVSWSKMIHSGSFLGVIEYLTNKRSDGSLIQAGDFGVVKDILRADTYTLVTFESDPDDPSKLIRVAINAPGNLAPALSSQLDARMDGSDLRIGDLCVLPDQATVLIKTANSGLQPVGPPTQWLGILDGEPDPKDLVDGCMYKSRMTRDFYILDGKSWIPQFFADDSGKWLGVHRSPDQVSRRRDGSDLQQDDCFDLIGYMNNGIRVERMFWKDGKWVRSFAFEDASSIPMSFRSQYSGVDVETVLSNLESKVISDRAKYEKEFALFKETHREDIRHLNERIDDILLAFNKSNAIDFGRSALDIFDGLNRRGGNGGGGGGGGGGGPPWRGGNGGDLPGGGPPGPGGGGGNTPLGGSHARPAKAEVPDKPDWTDKTADDSINPFDLNRIQEDLSRSQVRGPKQESVSVLYDSKGVQIGGIDFNSTSSQTEALLDAAGPLGGAEGGAALGGIVGGSKLGSVGGLAGVAIGAAAGSAVGAAVGAVSSLLGNSSNPTIVVQQWMRSSGANQVNAGFSSNGLTQLQALALQARASVNPNNGYSSFNLAFISLAANVAKISSGSRNAIYENLISIARERGVVLSTYLGMSESDFPRGTLSENDRLIRGLIYSILNRL